MGNNQDSETIFASRTDAGEIFYHFDPLIKLGPPRWIDRKSSLHESGSEELHDQLSYLIGSASPGATVMPWATTRIRKHSVDAGYKIFPNRKVQPFVCPNSKSFTHAFSQKLDSLSRNRRNERCAKNLSPARHARLEVNRGPIIVKPISL